MKKTTKNMIIMVLIMSGLLLGIYGFSYAKYASDSVWNYYLKTKGFYFSSDTLGKQEIKNINNIWNGENTYFNIKNSLNDSVTSDYDIKYKVTCEVENNPNITCNISDTNKNTYEGTLSKYTACVNETEDNVDVSKMTKTECEVNGYLWQNQVATKELYFNLTSSTEVTDATVNIIATSIEPYSQTLKGKFILHKSEIFEDNIETKYTNYSNYDRLVVTNKSNEDTCLKITWDDSLILEENKQELSSFLTNEEGYINEITIKVLAKNNKKLIFYSKTETVHDKNSFKIEETSNC